MDLFEFYDSYGKELRCPDIKGKYGNTGSFRNS